MGFPDHPPNLKNVSFRNASLFFILMAMISSSHAALREIGSTPQYFWDDYLIERLDNTRPRLNPAVKVLQNPVIRPDRPWEGTDNRIAWVLYDEALGMFRMRYTTGTYTIEGIDDNGELQPKRLNVRLCEAFSEDGIHWTKPDLGLVEFEGSTANNIVPEDQHRAYFFQDSHDPDPARRYKGHVRTGTFEGNGMTFDLFHSPDAYQWTAYENNPTVDTGDKKGRWGPTHFLGWDPIREVYAVHMENNLHHHSPWFRRSIGRAESPDLHSWSTPETLIVADEDDFPDTEFYALPTTFHNGLAIGFLWNFSTTNTQFHPQFVFSRDSIHYDRRYREPIIERGDAGDFDSVGVYATAPIFHQGKIYCYYTGINWRSPLQLQALGDQAAAGIGLAVLPEGGFVSLEGARYEWSKVTTRTFAFTGNSLSLNLQAALQQWGADPCVVQVAILDERHAPIEPFTFENCIPLKNTSIKAPVSWSGGGELADLEGRPVRLQIRFKNAKLYGFQFGEQP